MSAPTQFRKKPVVISAIQWTGENLVDVIHFTDGRPPNNKSSHAGMMWDQYVDLVRKDGLKIFTMEGKMDASIGDWIIKGVKGEHYPCKPEIFALTYEDASAGTDLSQAAVAAALETAKDALNKMPRREERLGGQRTQYIQLHEAVETIAALITHAQHDALAAHVAAEVAKARAEDAARMQSFDGADWFWRPMDPDDNADNPAEVIHRAYFGQFVVCEIASSYRGPTRFGFNAPTLDPESDDEVFLHFKTEAEAIDAAKGWIAALAQIGAKP